MGQAGLEPERPAVVASIEALEDIQHPRAIENTKNLLVAKITAKRLDQAKLGRGRYPAAPASIGLGGRRDPDLVPFDDDGRNLQVALDLEVILRLNELVDRVDAILTSDVPAGGEKLEV